MCIPPHPLRSPTAPSSILLANSGNGSPGTGVRALSYNIYVGPQTGHDRVCAWNLRSSGDEYSAWHEGHVGKLDMLVLALSNGTSAMTVNLAPHSVQFVNGNKCLLFLFERKSSTHCWHIAVSVGISETLFPSVLWAIENSPSSSSASSISARSILAREGSARLRRSRNSSASLSRCIST